MQLTLQSHAILNNGVEIPRLGLGVYQTPIGETTFRAVRYALKLVIDILILLGYTVMKGMSVGQF